MATFKFTTSSIKSTTKATDVKRIGRRRQSMDITQHPQYRKAILRIGESNCNIFHVKPYLTVHFSFISNYIPPSEFLNGRPRSERYNPRCK